MNLLVIVGSTRPGRSGLRIARWFVDRARTKADVTVADLRELDLPLLDEPHHPRLRRYVQQHTKDWSKVVDAADAIVFVTPEYNHGYPASVKNAIDYLHHEWQHKPVGFVSYGGVSAGTRAVSQLKQVVSAVKMVPIAESVNIPFHTQFLTDDGVQANDVMNQAADAMVDELTRVADALRPLRDKQRQAA